MKFIKIIIINIILLSVILIGFEGYYAYKWGCRIGSINNYFRAVFTTISAEEYFDKMYRHEDIPNTFAPYLRRDENTNSKRKAIILMGCSFAWGDRLEDNQTPSYKLAQLTKRPVYNRSGKGWGLSQFLFQLKSNKFYEVHTEPEYIIYIIISEQINRINKFKITPVSPEFQPRFEIKEGKLNIMKPNIFDRLVTVQNFQYSNWPSFNEGFDIASIYFLEAYKEIKKHWKNTKLIILEYPLPGEYYQFYENDIIKELKNNGVIFINAKDFTTADLTDNKYKVDDLHPSSEAWDLILPKIVKKLKLD